VLVIGKIWTWSGWVKSYFLGAADQYSVFNSGLNTSTHNGTSITFTNDGIFRIINQNRFRHFPSMRLMLLQQQFIVTLRLGII
jgi:hypothetical protein